MHVLKFSALITQVSDGHRQVIMRRDWDGLQWKLGVDDEEGSSRLTLYTHIQTKRDRRKETESGGL